MVAEEEVGEAALEFRLWLILLEHLLGLGEELEPKL